MYINIDIYPNKNTIYIFVRNDSLSNIDKHIISRNSSSYPLPPRNYHEKDIDRREFRSISRLKRLVSTRKIERKRENQNSSDFDRKRGAFMRYHASSFAFVSTLSNVHVHTLKASSKGEKVPASWSHHDDPLPLTPAAEAGSRGPCPGGTVSKVAWLCIYIYIQREEDSIPPRRTNRD